ncbi:MAG: DUF5724 domain-containing protein [Bacteroidota bacterium]
MQFSEVWELMDLLPYQTGYTRKPFRTNSAERMFAKKLDLLGNLYRYGLQGFAKLPLEDVARYDVYAQWGATPAHLYFAVALNREAVGGPFFTLLCDILQGEDDIGGTTRAIINGLLLSKHPACWQLVEKLLLAAQRQEGLRQTILESVDETRIESFRHFIKVILEHKLARFSSVVRAVDTWFGMGWDAPKKAAVTRTLELATTYLDDEAAARAALTSKDNLEVFLALWSQGLVQIKTAVRTASDVFVTGSRSQQTVAGYFLHQSDFTHQRIDEWAAANYGQDIEVDYWATLNFSPHLELTDLLFQQMLTYAEALPKGGQTFAGSVFSWLNPRVTPEFFYNFIIARANKDQLIELSRDISKIPSDSRETFFRKLFPKYHSYSLRWGNEEKRLTKIKLTTDDWRRELIHQGLTDRNSSVQATSLNLLRNLSLSEAEYTLIVDLLRRKAKFFRAALLKIVLAQPTKVLLQLTDDLLAASNVDQRLAGLEILTVLHEKKQQGAYVEQQVTAYRARPQLNKNEEVLLAKFASSEPEFRLDNGFGAIDFSDLTPMLEPQRQFTEYQSLLGKMLPADGGFLFGKFVDAEKITRAINDLLARLRASLEYEYTGYGYGGHPTVVLLGESLLLTGVADEATPATVLDLLPLPDVWREWYEQSGLNDFELLYARYYLEHHEQPFGLHVPFRSFLRRYLPEVKGISFGKTKRQGGLNHQAGKIVRYFYAAKVDHPTVLKFQLDMLEDACARLPQTLWAKLQSTYVGMFGRTHTSQVHWSDVVQHQLPATSQDFGPAWIANQDPADMLRLWRLTHFMCAAKMTNKYPPPATAALLHPDLREYQGSTPPAWLSILLHERGLLTDADLRVQFLLNAQLRNVAEGGGWARYPEAFRNRIPVAVFTPLRKNLLAVELERGEMPTEASAYVSDLSWITGVAYLTALVERLGTTKLDRGYVWNNKLNRKTMFSQLIQKCQPEETDTAQTFLSRARKIKFSKKRWLEVAMYAPQWADWIGQLLRINDLEGAVWWFHAHATDYSSKDKQAIVARFSPIEHQEFRDGAIDLHWFHEAYGAVGKGNWKLLHEAAKYVSDGNGHRQVKTYSAVMLGEIKITETTKRVKEKRDKVFVKALGLIPLSRTNPRRDVLKRYNLLQTFRREAKQFGAQRQASEQLAADIGLDNLARNAGYADTVQFSWVMEGEATREIMETASVLLDNVEIELLIDAQGRADLHVSKNGKPQKSIPTKYRKHKLVKALKENKTLLRKQYQRTRASLENAMVSVRTFSAAELAEIFTHPIVRAMLLKLVLYAPERQIAGFWADGRLHSADGTLHELQDEDQLLIAHPAHLYQLVEWDRYQAYAFDHALVQPFKQIFRELYLVTADEREARYQSSRYQGHQIQPKKTAALLRSRGWVADRDEGLQKVFHQKNIIATLYAMADWFSPAEVEAPVLEHVAFYSRKDYQHLPLTEIDPVLFSEVMRDVDLVVSVAHVGQVDPEASHSSLEMRAALARESARLFKLTNVEVKERHVLIKGTMGAYAIHLGSGKVSRDGLQLSIIPVHSQHRGRIFLPFLDDDPKSAEIISKMRMLALDDKIQDPTVLAQIVR